VGEAKRRAERVAVARGALAERVAQIAADSDIEATGLKSAHADVRLAVAFNDAIVRHAMTPDGQVSTNAITVAVVSIIAAYHGTLPEPARGEVLQSIVDGLNHAMRRSIDIANDQARLISAEHGEAGHG